MYIVSIFRAISRDFLVFFWPASNLAKVIRLGVFSIVVILPLYFIFGSSTPDEDTEKTLPQTVNVSSVAELQNDTSTVFIGSVRALSESDMQFEIGGRVTSVPVSVGQAVKAGTILALVENSLQQASVLQAQGAYEAARAAAALSSLGVEDAERAVTTAKLALVSAMQTTYSAANTSVRGTVDVFYGNPDSFTPGVRISTSNSMLLNEMRVSLQKNLPTWESKVNQAGINSDLDTLAASTLGYLNDVIALVDAFVTEVNLAKNSDTIGSRSVVSYGSELATIKSNLTGLRGNIENSLSGIATAEDALRKAKIGSQSGNLPSAANAQLTQALGSLRAAQSQLEKTIVRAPISGTVDVLRIRVGEYVSANTPVALVTGGSGFEISLFVGERDAELFSIGATAVVDGDQTATVVSISNTIDPTTLKREVVLSFDTDTDYVSGDTISVQLSASERTVSAMIVPITALKFVNTDGFMFTVEDGRLVLFPVEVGVVSGGSVEIVKGIDTSTRFVVDVRGKSAGQEVTVSK